MSAIVINLRQARKHRQRERNIEQAAEQRARFGQGKAERNTEELRQRLMDRQLDGARSAKGCHKMASDDDAKA